jgi:hypothetical protein
MRDGAVYEGEFKNDEITGKGKIIYVNLFLFSQTGIVMKDCFWKGRKMDMENKSRIMKSIKDTFKTIPDKVH